MTDHNDTEACQQGLAVPSGVKLERFAARIDPDIPFERFAEGLHGITKLTSVAQESLPYWVGDMLNYGEDHFANRYEQVVELTDYVKGTIHNIMWVCRHVPPANRGIMPFSHTAAVAKMPSEEQKVMLERGRDEGLTQSEFRKLVSGDPAYKSKALPGDISKSERENKALEAFDGVWDIHSDDWTSTATPIKDRFWKCWKKAVELAFVSKKGK